MSHREFQAITGCDVKHFAPGAVCTPEDYQAGDFIMTHIDSFYGRLIRFGQGLRFMGTERPFTWWNHAALIANKNGDLIEAIDAGVRNSNLTKYAATEYQIIRLGALASEHDREQMVTFANWCLNEPYGWFTIVSITFSLLTGCKLSFGFEGQAICSGLVARALERGNAIFNRSPSHMMPADLAKYFNIRPDAAWTKKDRGRAPARVPFRAFLRGAAHNAETVGEGIKEGLKRQ